MSESKSFIGFDGKNYVINIKRLFECLAEYTPAEITKEKHKSEQWGYNPYDEECKNFKCLSKETVEMVKNDKETFASVKYDLYKNLLQLVLNPTIDDEGNIIPSRSMEDFYFGQAVAFNTLLNDGIIIEVTD